MKKEKKKIGVISFYYKNYNYGGQLQAYALVKKLNQLGFQAEQICFDRTSAVSPFKTHTSRQTTSLGHYLRAARNKIQTIWGDHAANALIEQRKMAIQGFSDGIPHSDMVYYSGKMPGDAYDGYVCGSDQVWNPSYTRDEYFLGFAAEGKKRIAYAASIGRSVLNDEELSYISERIKQIDVVSVREEDAQKLIQKHIRQDVSYVLDPTLLLNRAEWDEVCADRVVDGPYALAYFLGDDVKQRNAAVCFARQHHCKLVTFPYILGRFRAMDKNFGDVQVYEGPAQFISLIRNADYVITDSFHATVFSGIYERPFVVFGRSVNSKEKNMNSRIESLLGLMESPERLMDPSVFMENDGDIMIPDRPYFKERFEAKKQESIRFLQMSLSDSRGEAKS